MKGLSFFQNLTGLLLLSSLVACETINDDPVFPLEPNIVLVDVSQDSIQEFTEQLVITLQYEDGDGDLGTSDPDVNSIFVQDNRLENPDEYYLPPLAPEDATISITGSFELELSPTFLLGNGSQEIAEFSIYLYDRAGHISNTVNTGPIVIYRE